MKDLRLVTLLLVASAAVAQPLKTTESPVHVADAKPGQPRLIVSLGMKAPLEAVRAQAEAAVGHPLVIEYGASLTLKNLIESGQAFELAILTPGVLDELTAKGKILPGSRFDVARVPVSIGQRGDAPKCDIGTTEALKKSLLNAKSIRWGTIGASVPTINKMLEVLGIGDQIKPHVNMPGGAVALGPGEYELHISLASEILPLKDEIYLGDIPQAMNIPAVMAAGIGSAGNAEEGKALIRFLKGSAIEPALKVNGMSR
jgi:molybdate transport system substrate-binding protein